MSIPILARPALEVADVIRQHGAEFLQRYGSGLAASQRQALRDLARCRTAALGGHVERCLDGGHEQCAYNSCRNRHCPKCQALTRAQWLDRQAEHLLPVEYYHVVFTLPAEVRRAGVGPACGGVRVAVAQRRGHAASGGGEPQMAGGHGRGAFGLAYLGP